MFCPFSTRTMALVILVLITDIKHAHTQDAAQNDTDSSTPSDLAVAQLSRVPCHALKSPIDNLKSALKDMELINELFCSNAAHAPETMRSEGSTDQQENEEQGSVSQYSQIQTPNNEQEPLARAITYPYHYHQYPQYPHNYYYNYGDRSNQSPQYYYQPQRSPYTAPVYPVIQAPPPVLASPPSLPPPSMVQANTNNVAHGANENSTDSNSTAALTDDDKKIKKNKHCAKKQSSKKKSEKIDVNDENNVNSNKTDSNDTEAKSN